MIKSRIFSRIIFLLFITLALLAIVINLQPMHIGRAASGCQVVYTPNTWNTGFTADVRIINNNTTPISGWTLTWSFANGQQITGAWNAAVTQSGANVTATVPAGDWNGTIGANGGSVSFGFQATHTGTNDIPTNFALNGVACNDTSATNTPTVTRTPTSTPSIRPDLTVSGIQYFGGAPGSCVSYANDGTRVTIRNIGNADAGRFNVMISGTSSAAYQATVSGLAAGAETTVFFAGVRSGGPTTAFADWAREIDELNEDNNYLTVNVPIPTGYPPYCTPTPTIAIHPDLVISEMVYAPGLSGTCFIPANEGTRVTVRNIGNANAGTFNVMLSGTANAMPSLTVPGLAAGAQTTLLFVGYHAGGPTTAIADPADVIDEISEDNNQLTVALPVPTSYPPVCTPTPTATRSCTTAVTQAEAASFGGGATVERNNAGYTGTGFVNFPLNGGYLQLNNVNGGSGGNGTLRIRYALGASSRTGQLMVLDTVQNITFSPTGSWSTWAIREITIPMTAGATNTIRFQSNGQDLANIDQIEVVACGTATPTFTPTPTTALPCGTLAPGQTPVPGCFPSDTAFTGCAYLDENGNGAIDPGEPRLGGMSFSITLNGGTGFGATTSAGQCAAVIVPSTLPIGAWPVLARMVAPAGSGYQLVGSSVISLAYPQTRADYLFVVSQ